MRLYQRGKRGTWWVDLGDIAGQRARRSTGTCDEQEAKEYAATLARDLWRTRRLGESPRVTWDQAALAWLEDHQHRRNLEAMKRTLRWLTDRLAGRALADITDGTIRKLVTERKAQQVAPGKPSSNATVNRHTAQLSAVLHYSQRRGWLPVVPPILKLPEPAKRVAWLTREQADALLAELPSHLKAMAMMAMATGLRESNVRLLCWQQVDLARRVAWIYADQAKGDRDIGVPLNDEAVAVLEAQSGLHKRWVFPAPRWEKKARPDDKPRQKWDAPTGKASSAAWRKACIRAGVPWLRFHDLRHTWASWHVQAGTPLAVLQELGGWRDAKMVGRYAHLGESHLAAWAGNLGTKVAQAAQTPGTDGTPAPGASERKTMGWLMGLEPTTTGITILDSTN